MLRIPRLSQLDENLTAKFVIPVALENCFTVFITMAISGVVSTISASALAAIAMANSIMAVVSALFSVVTTGGGVMVARHVGAQEYKDAAESIEQSAFMSLIATVSIMVLSMMMAVPLLRLLMPTAEAGMFGEAVRYFRMVMISLPFLVLHGVFSGACRGLGNSRTPLLTTIVMNLCQLIFAWICISVLSLNEIGAGVAIIICRIVGAGILFRTLMKDRKRVVLQVRGMFRPKLGVCRRILRIGLPLTVESLFVQFGYMLANSMSIALGGFESAVFQIVNTVYSFACVTHAIFLNISMSACGHLLGRKDYKGLRTAVYTMWFMGLLVSSAMALIAIVFGRQLCGLYTDDPATLEACLKVMWILLPMNIVANANNITDPAMRAGGDSGYVMIVALITVWGLRLPLTWLLCFKLDMGVLGVFLANTLALTFRTISGMIRFSFGKWMYKKV